MLPAVPLISLILATLYDSSKDLNTTLLSIVISKMIKIIRLTNGQGADIPFLCVLATVQYW